MPRFESLGQKIFDPNHMKQLINSLPTASLLNRLYQQKGGTVGLDNLGNTCYFNSVLQCLRHMMPLNLYLFSRKVEPVLEKNIYIHSDPKKVLEQQGCIALVVAYVHTLARLWGCGYISTNPSQLKFVFDSLNESFRDRGQHDAHECLVSILNSLHEGLSRKVIYTFSGQVINDFDRQIQQAQNDWKKQYQERHSIILDIFGGQFQTKCVCFQCNQPSYRFDPFLAIELPLPTDISKIAPVSYTLTECLTKYVEPERLSLSNYRSCEHCKRKTPGYKVQSIWTLPNVLIISLKRFNKNYNNGHYESHKIEDFIHYPLTGLNLSKFVSNPNTHNDHALYDLFGVICHRGNEDHGHYYAYCYNTLRQNWYTFNDSQVTEMFNHNMIITKDAYILFYQKQGIAFYP